MVLVSPLASPKFACQPALYQDSRNSKSETNEQQKYASLKLVCSHVTAEDWITKMNVKN
jgi:hypothetical protein